MRMDSSCDLTSENLPLGVSVIRVEVQCEGLRCLSPIALCLAAEQFNCAARIQSP